MVQIIGGSWANAEYTDVRGTLTNFGRVILEMDTTGAKKVNMETSTYVPPRVTLLKVKKTMYNILD
jgi:hypothetical protein